MIFFAIYIIGVALAFVVLIIDKAITSVFITIGDVIGIFFKSLLSYIAAIIIILTWIEFDDIYSRVMNFKIWRSKYCRESRGKEEV